MELMKHWRAEPTRASQGAQEPTAAQLGAAVAAGAMVAVAMPVLSSVSSDAAVGGRRSIEVTTTSDLVILRATRVVPGSGSWRSGTEVIVGFATKRIQPGGASRSTTAAGLTAGSRARTPNLGPGDKIRTRIIATARPGTPAMCGACSSTAWLGADSVTVTGRVRLGDGRTAVNPARDIRRAAGQERPAATSAKTSTAV